MNKIIDDTIKTNSKMGSFLHDVERIHKNGKIDYMEAIVHYCEVNSIDIEVAAQYIKKNAMLKAKIQQEAEDLNFLEKTARLPL
jgi:predicted transcriptional regulator